MVANQHIQRRYQRTVASSVTCNGIGLHSGLLVNMTLQPAPPDYGVVFRRIDLPGVVSIRASRENLRATTLCTSLGNAAVQVQTVEHLLAALTAMGVDNVLVELDAPEVPIMDGSALPFISLIERAGLREQRKAKAYLKITRAVEVSDGDKLAVLEPAEVTSVTCEIDFAHPLIRHQAVTYEHSQEAFIRDIAPARTFGFKHDIDYLVRNGFARGGSLDNAVVLDDRGVMNDGGLRFEDEFVRHKILDAIGDLSLAGYPILGHLVVRKSGHALNGVLVDALLHNRDCWELVRLRPGSRQFSLRLPDVSPRLAAQYA